jgi:hypothetical protein
MARSVPQLRAANATGLPVSVSDVIATLGEGRRERVTREYDSTSGRMRWGLSALPAGSVGMTSAAKRDITVYRPLPVKGPSMLANRHKR